jgi:L-rhamnose mutarotase
MKRREKGNEVYILCLSAGRREKDGAIRGAHELRLMAKMAADPTTQEPWAITMPMPQPIPTRAQGEWWANMKEVFHVD